MPPPGVSELADRALYYSTYWLWFHALSLGLGLRAAGRANVPRTGPLLLIANHQSFVDPVLVGQAAPRRLRYLARHTLFEVPVIGRVIRAYGGVPIDRGFGREGLQTVLDRLAAGEAVVVFGEGERTHTGAIQPLKAGVALLLKKAACPVVPVGVAGAFEMWPRHHAAPDPEPLFLRAERRSVAVAFGPALDPAALAGPREGVLETLRLALESARRTAEGVRRHPTG